MCRTFTRVYRRLLRRPAAAHWQTGCCQLGVVGRPFAKAVSIFSLRRPRPRPHGAILDNNLGLIRREKATIALGADPRRRGSVVPGSGGVDPDGASATVLDGAGPSGIRIGFDSGLTYSQNAWAIIPMRLGGAFERSRRAFSLAHTSGNVKSIEKISNGSWRVQSHQTILFGPSIATTVG